MDKETPLFIEPLIGFRKWLWRDGLLLSPYRASSNRAWGNSMRAACTFHDHPAPDPNCSCGLYAYHHPQYEMSSREYNLTSKSQLEKADRLRTEIKGRYRYLDILERVSDINSLTGIQEHRQKLIRLERSLNLIMGFQGPTLNWIEGVVRAWGKIEVYEYGFRAKHMEILALAERPGLSLKTYQVEKVRHQDLIAAAKSYGYNPLNFPYQNLEAKSGQIWGSQ